MIRLLLLCIGLCSLQAISQEYNPLNSPNSYRSKENPHYWKNKPPFPGYWQQDVHYTIQADINELTDIITATEELIYWNNSPDTLTFVYFHLYQNAFQPDSYCDDLHQANNYPIRYGRYEKQKLGTVVSNIKVDGVTPQTELDNTILKVFLPKPLYPGTSTKFTMNFQTYFDYGGSIRRRMKMFSAYGYKHFDGVHWYPRITVYDRKFGWSTDQHLGKEFYGDFGTYDVSLTFSSDYVVEATGFLTNREEVLPKDLREKLDIKNFKDKPWEQAPSVITPYDPNQRKTWKFHAENVHDFAWTADPTYRIGETWWNGIQIVSLVQEPHASKWQNAADFTAKVIETYSRDFGMYVYNKMVVADARDGMEYPMLTLDGGSDPSYRGLLAHEVGHNWFFGMVGNNETYRAMLDEGFTQFLTVWAMEHIDGRQTIKNPHPSAYKQKYTIPEQARYARAYYGYLRGAIRHENVTINTHSDDFGGALRHGGGYGSVYYKTATMLFNLQYVLGDTLFQNAMKHYFNQWKIAHPYPEDFRESIIRFTKVDLNWFFDQWIETPKTIDYSIKKVKKTKQDGVYKITFSRKGEMQMPLDFVVSDAEGKEYAFHIPNNWFVKETDATVLPRWIGWGKLKTDYTATVSLQARIQDVIIDTTKRLADFNLMNNSWKSKSKIAFDSRVANQAQWDSYRWLTRPDVWYNYYDGFKVGIHLNGSYMNYLRRLNLTVWLNSGLAKVRNGYESDLNGYNPISFNASYIAPTHRLIKDSELEFKARYLDGLAMGQAGWSFYSNNDKTKWFAFAKAMIRPDSSDILYLMYRDGWNPGQWNNTVNIGFEHTYGYRKGMGVIRALAKSSSIASDYQYAQVRFEVVNKNYPLRKIGFHTRLFAQWGTGSNPAPESLVYLAGANPEDMMEDKFVRSAAFFPQSFNGWGATTNSFHHGGGLNVRGYAGYLAPETRSDGAVVPAYAGISGVSANTELEFDRLFKFRPRFTRNWLKLNTYFFGDAGMISIHQPGERHEFGNLRVSAGAGAAFTIKKWGPLDLENPLTLRFDVPFFLSRTPNEAPDFVQFRWIIGVNRAF